MPYKSCKVVCALTFAANQSHSISEAHQFPSTLLPSAAFTRKLELSEQNCQILIPIPGAELTDRFCFLRNNLLPHGKKHRLIDGPSRRLSVQPRPRNVDKIIYATFSPTTFFLHRAPATGGAFFIPAFSHLYCLRLLS